MNEHQAIFLGELLIIMLIAFLTSDLDKLRKEIKEISKDAKGEGK